MAITIAEKRQQLTDWLIKELGTPDRVKAFSQELRDSGLCDLRNDKQFEIITANGSPMLMTALSWYNFGFLNKFIEIKNKIQEK
jgi:hypothetical protein